MKLQRSTQGLLLAALLLGSGVAIYEGTIVPERRAQQERGDRLFSLATADVQRLTITTPERSLQFDRLETSQQVPLTEDSDGQEFTTTDWEFVRLDEPEKPDEPDESEAPDTPEEDSENEADAPEADVQDDVDRADDDDSAEDADVEVDDATEDESEESEESADAQPPGAIGDDSSEDAEDTQDETDLDNTDAAEDAEDEEAGNSAESDESGESEKSDQSDTSKAANTSADTSKNETEAGPIPARQAYIDFLFGQLEQVTSDRRLSAPAKRRAEYGLAPPALTLMIELKDGTRHTLELGSRDFTAAFIYGLVDTPEDAAQLEVLLLPPNLMSAFDRELSEWDATVPLDSGIDLPEPTPGEPDESQTPEAPDTSDTDTPDDESAEFEGD